MDGIGLAEYAGRRESVLKALKGAAAVVFAGDGGAPLVGRWRADSHFVYLTGIDDEPGAAVLFDPSAEDPKRRIALCLRPLDPEAERWDGMRAPINAALKEKTGFKTVLRTGSIPAALTVAARRTKRLACLHPFAVYPAPVSADLAAYRQVAERIPGIAIEDQTELLKRMRAVKSRAELGLMRRAVDATAAGYAAALPMIRPGATEAEVCEALERGYRENGGTGLPYNSIVGGGINGTILHYSANRDVLREGELLVIDSAAEVQGYAADVTRTLPVSGRFTPEQRELYEVVLRAQLAAIRAAKPGAFIWQVDAAARMVIDRAGLGDAFIHGIGHQLGLQVHDVTPDGALRPGMVITIEPGIYLPEKRTGIRIEDDVLITRGGNEVLSSAVPKTVAQIEAAMGPR